MLASSKVEIIKEIFDQEDIPEYHKRDLVDIIIAIPETAGLFFDAESETKSALIKKIHNDEKLNEFKKAELIRLVVDTEVKRPVTNRVNPL